VAKVAAAQPLAAQPSAAQASANQASTAQPSFAEVSAALAATALAPGGQAQSGPAPPGQSMSGGASLALAPSGKPTSGSGSAKVLRPTQPLDPTKIAKSAKDFEAMALGELLKPMFDTVDTSKGTFGGGPGEEAWKPLMVQEFAKQIAAQGGLGLAKPVYDAMLRMQEANPK
jgi:hypothetical protein